MLTYYREKTGFFSVGCETDRAIPELRNHLQKTAANIDMMGLKWPYSYSEAENTIKMKADENRENIPHIKRQELYNIFREKGIEENNFENVANLMGMLGVITHFPDCPDLRDFVVIKPQWLTKAVSLVLEDDQLKNDQGEITHSKLRTLWEVKYPELYSLRVKM